MYTLLGDNNWFLQTLEFFRMEVHKAEHISLQVSY